jgi:hypothetical protein
VVIVDVHEKELLARAIIELIETNDGVQRAVIRCACSSPNIVKVI